MSYFVFPRPYAFSASRVRLVCTAATSSAFLLLVGCGSTPLPPWPAQGSQGPAQPGTVVAPSAPVAPVTFPAPPGVVTSPIAPPWGTVAPGAGVPPVADDNAPFGAAVAARFPEPVVRYRTPGLEDGRRAFSTNAELTDWLAAIARSSANRSGGSFGVTRSKLLQLGPSQEGQPILALVLTRGKGTSPDAVGATGRPTVLLMGQQRGNEPAGTESLMVMAQELAGGLLEPLLDRINVIVVPRANPDAADSGNPFTAAGVDMVTDHLLLSTPEARALATLVRDYRPTLVVDAREFEAGGPLLNQLGGVQSYDALLEYSTAANLPDFIIKAAREWYYEPMAAALTGEALRADWYFTPQPNTGGSRVEAGSVMADTARNVSALKNAVGIVVSTRGVGIGRAHLQRRVHTQVVALSSLLRSTAQRASNLEQVRSFVARDTSALACRGDVSVNSAPTPAQRNVVVLDPQTGEERVKRVSWNTPLQLRTESRRSRPCGYWLSASSDNVVDRLQLMGVQVLRVAEGGSLVADGTDPRERSDSAPARSGALLARSNIEAPEGSFYIPLNQPLANLAVAALEPGSSSGYVARGVIDDASQMARIVATPSLVFEERN